MRMCIYKDDRNLSGDNYLAALDNKWRSPDEIFFYLAPIGFRTCMCYALADPEGFRVWVLAFYGNLQQCLFLHQTFHRLERLSIHHIWDNNNYSTLWSHWTFSSVCLIISYLDWTFSIQLGLSYIFIVSFCRKVMVQLIWFVDCEGLFFWKYDIKGKLSFVLCFQII